MATELATANTATAATTANGAAGTSLVSEVSAIGTKTLTAVKAAVISPLFGGIVLVGIIAYQFWKGGKDSRDIEMKKAA